MNEVTFRVPDFTGPDGTRYTDIEVVVRGEDDGLRQTAKLEETAKVLMALTEVRP